jgi:hypothetical protein
MQIKNCLLKWSLLLAKNVRDKNQNNRIEIVYDFFSRHSRIIWHMLQPLKRLLIIRYSMSKSRAATKSATTRTERNFMPSIYFDLSNRASKSTPL